ncbi:MAG: C40 family peptidase [Oscillospiraceae bacterium]|nr:C40 family peptidase [Oscillospiraceae bacterium]
MFRSRKFGFRLLAAVLCLMCLMCNLHPMGAVAAEEKKQQTLTTIVHNRAYTSAAIIGQMEDGTEITVLGETREFYKIDCYDMNGYIAKTQVVHTEDGKYYVNCVAGSTETRTLDYTDHADALTLRHALLDLAKDQLGSRYVYGSSRPGAFDCSGLMYYLYGQHGIQLHRNASAQMQDGIIVAKDGLQVGDLIFFREYGEASLCSHVGIYAGNGQIIHAGSPGVVYADLDFDYFDKYYLCARRIVNTDAAAMEATDPAISPVAAPATIGRRTR